MTMAGQEREIDSVLLVAFGGPTPGCCKERDPCPGEAYCFVHGILGTSPAREKRVREVAAHYKELGGFSPMNDLTLAQARELERALASRGLALPVVCGMRHWRPLVRDALAELASRGLSRPLAVIMAPHQSTVSWDWYVKVAGEAEDELGASSPRIAGYLDPWFREEGFVRANAERVREATAGWDRSRFQACGLVFTAHAIPKPVERTSPYVRQLGESAAAVARLLEKPAHEIAFQSQPGEGGSSIPWSSPDVSETIEKLAREGKRDVVLCPIGFLCDHVEVLYDLDVAARGTACEHGLGYFRAGTVGSHPSFLGMLADRIAARVGR
ncbi:ferrochelatase [bacterium]|nr:ferrochelatase [bacterium]